MDLKLETSKNILEFHFEIFKNLKFKMYLP